MARHRMLSRTLWMCVVFTASLAFLIGGYFGLLDPYDDFDDLDYIISNRGSEKQSIERNEELERSHIPHPVVLWWTPFTLEKGAVRQCGTHQCFFTNNRQYLYHNNTKVLFFYGSDFDITDLPLPRQPHHEWALLHEESPKNVFFFSHEDIMSMFNHTCTFREESHFPITTQYLVSVDDIESTKYLISTAEKTRIRKKEKLALVNFVQSDCDVPSDRDHLVQMLQRFLEVDSYGQCEHNKDLPEHLQDPIEGMAHEDLYHLLAQYKFTLALENAICQQYITEKFWRPFKVGSVPIIFDSPKIREYLPHPKSALIVEDFTNVSELVDLLIQLDNNDTAYEEYLQYKRTGVTSSRIRSELQHRSWGTNDEWNKPNFIESFECFVCTRVHENLKREEEGKHPVKFQADSTHYGCPKPLRLEDYPKGHMQRVENSWWGSEWDITKKQAAALRHLLANGETNITQETILNKMKFMYQNKKNGS